ncbi:MAG: ECF-type sigma factor [Acidobacteriota bacterium]
MDQSSEGPLESGAITEILRQWSDGDGDALHRLMPFVEADLRRRARRALAGERAGHTLEPTALVNEVYLRLVGQRQVSWRNRAQFFGFAAQVMRRILVEHARRRQRVKRGGDAVVISLDQVGEPADRPRDLDLLALDRALTELAGLDPRQGRIVELRYFAGLTLDETAEVLSVSASLVSREWTLARAWLYRRLHSAEG